jgi:hypothetical protein
MNNLLLFTYPKDYLIQIALFLLLIRKSCSIIGIKLKAFVVLSYLSAPYLMYLMLSSRKYRSFVLKGICQGFIKFDLLFIYI